MPALIEPTPHPSLSHVFLSDVFALKHKLKDTRHPASDATKATLPPDPDLLELFGPGDALTSSRMDFVTTYSGVNQPFDQLTRTPYLDQIIVSGHDSEGLRSFLLNLNGLFQVYAAQEAASSRNLISLGGIIPMLPTGRKVSEYDDYISCLEEGSR